MAAPKIYNWWRRPPELPKREGERPNNTEQGYLSLRVQVKRMKEAGQRLAEFKRDYYDQFEEDFDNVITENESR